MNQVSRRKFLLQTAMGMGAAITLPSILRANGISPDFKQAIGFQSYPIKTILMKDFPGTLKMMAGLGYQNVEMCSPVGYADDGYASLVPMKPKDMKKIIEDQGLSCKSCHFTFNELKADIDGKIQWAKDLGLSAIMIQSFWLPDSATIKDYQNACATLNKMAEKINKAGLETAYHNHEMEFKEREGVLIYDAMMQALDPKLVKMQFQAEVINLGYKAADYFRKYPGRFISSHLSDWTKEKKEVPIGQGVIDWKDFFTAAKVGGVKYFYVEMALDTFKPSAEYIRSLV